MVAIASDRVKQTTTTDGTGTYSLTGTSTGFQGFVAGVGDGNTCYYCVTDGTDWEVNLGTVADLATDTVTRDTLIDSSTGSAINWTGGAAKEIFVCLPAEKAYFAGGTPVAVVDGGTGGASAAIAQTNLELVGQQTIWIPAGAMEPNVTTQPATSNAVEISTSVIALRTMDFATDGDDHAGFAVQMPKSWDGSTFVVQFVWSNASGTGGVTWGVRAGAFSDSDALTTALGTMNRSGFGGGSNF
jgi:hypothetical protein